MPPRNLRPDPIPERVIDVEGLDGLRSALRRLGPEYRKSLDKDLKEAAAPIAREAKSLYRRFHPRSRRRRGSQRGIRASASGGKSRVVLGGVRYPYLLGQEWGSKRFLQFPARKDSLPPDKRGYFFWPSVVAGRDQLLKDIDNAITKANNQIFQD